MSRKICSWLTVIVRLLRGTRQASGGRHFEDFTYHSSLRNAFITFEHFYYPPFRFSANVTDFENWKTPVNPSRMPSGPARKGGKSRRDRLGFIALRTAGFEDGRTNDADCCQSIFKRCQAARYFRWQRATRVSSRDSTIFDTFPDPPREIERLEVAAIPSHGIFPHFPFYPANSWGCGAG